MRIHQIVDDHNTCLCLSLNILKCIVSIDLKRVTILANSSIATINKGSYKLYSLRQRYMEQKKKNKDHKKARRNSRRQPLSWGFICLCALPMSKIILIFKHTLLLLNIIHNLYNFPILLVVLIHWRNSRTLCKDHYLAGNHYQ